MYWPDKECTNETLLHTMFCLLSVHLVDPDRMEIISRYPKPNVYTIENCVKTPAKNHLKVLSAYVRFCIFLLTLFRFPPSGSVLPHAPVHPSDCPSQIVSNLLNPTAPTILDQSYLCRCFF